MENNADYVKTILRELRSTVSEQISAKLNLAKCERIVEKLDSFSVSCEECQQLLLELKNHFIQLKENVNQIEDTELKQHKQLINHIVSHLQKTHKMVAEGYYLGLFLSLGLIMGIVFGLTIFKNIGLGIPIGMCMGVAIGAGMDADAKKKGNTI